jgi:hypothetical protein
VEGVGVELLIARIEAKFKLSQNRSAADVDGVLSGLITTGHEDAAQAVRRARTAWDRFRFVLMARTQLHQPRVAVKIPYVVIYCCFATNSM